MSEIELNNENFDQEINKDVPIIVDFWASWCGPCQMLGPVFEELSKEYDATKLRFAKCSTETSPEPPSKYGVTGIPCLILFKNGKEVDRIVGFMPKDALKAKIDEILSKA
ncbi:MAG: thioredoxin [Candidatus Woesearchaeota archaeon]